MLAGYYKPRKEVGAGWLPAPHSAAMTYHVDCQQYIVVVRQPGGQLPG